MPLGTVLNALMRQFVRDKEITLSARFPNAESWRAMHDARERKNLETFNSFEQFIYDVSDSEVLLVRTGTHADLFE